MFIYLHNSTIRSRGFSPWCEPATVSQTVARAFSGLLVEVEKLRQLLGSSRPERGDWGGFILFIFLFFLFFFFTAFSFASLLPFSFLLQWPIKLSTVLPHCGYQGRWELRTGQETLRLSAPPPPPPPHHPLPPNPTSFPLSPFIFCRLEINVTTLKPVCLLPPPRPHAVLFFFLFFH